MFFHRKNGFGLTKKSDLHAKVPALSSLTAKL